MRIYRLIAAFTFLAAITALPAYAQTNARPAAGASANTAAPAAGSAAVPESKIALINTEAFADEKQGITRLVAAVKKVDGEFTPRRTELQGLRTGMDKLTDELSKIQQGQGVVSPQSIQQKQEQLDQMKRDMERKTQDAQIAYNKRLQEVVGPIYDEIGKALDAFGRSRGITMMLDSSKLAPAIIMAQDTMDITRAFIADFNSRPATASAAAPR